jgi:hypothetical protein
VITARVDTNSQELFVRNRVRVLASFTDENQQTTILGRAADGADYYWVVPPGAAQSAPPEGVSLYALDASTDVARAVYEALKTHFEPKDPAPTAADRAYSDARADIVALHGLINKLVDASGPNRPDTW